VIVRFLVNCLRTGVSRSQHRYYAQNAHRHVYPLHHKRIDVSMWTAEGGDGNLRDSKQHGFRRMLQILVTRSPAVQQPLDAE